MANTTTIPATAIPPTQDFFYLRQKGLEYVQQLSSRLWTDHNLHDPGITILEVLCYALMDLGYRNSFSMKDLVTEPDGTPSPDAFHTARSILPAQPVSLLDYRRLLIDIPGVRNAWLFTANASGLPFGEGIALHAWCKGSTLLYTSEIDTAITEFEERAHVRQQEEVRIHGIYAVRLDLDEHPLYGDLNSSVVTIKPVKGELAGYELQLSFPNWQHNDANGKELISLYKAHKPEAVAVSVLNDTSLTDANFKNLVRRQFKTRWVIKYGAEERVLNNVKIKVVKAPSTANGLVKAAVLETGMNTTEGIQALKRFTQRPAEVLRVFEAVRNVLMKHRNLCEDFQYSLRIIDTEDLALCAEVDVETGTDLETIQASIFAAIENYLLPPVQFSTLRELLDKGTPVEEIFEGPALHHGVLTNDALSKADLRSEFYLSDIISLLMDIPGIMNVRNCIFSVFDSNGNVIPQPFDWKILVKALHKMRLSREQCKFTYYKNNLPLQANFVESIQKLRLSHLLESHRKYKDPQNDLPVPVGKYRQLNQYETILNEFPKVYGLGDKDLPEGVTIERKAQVKQLEAYLTFFDQLLANYFGQLNQMKRLLSWDNRVDNSYVANYFYNNEDALQLFANDGLTMDAEQMQSITQSMVESQDHRNRLLDHLLSRFAESFGDYAMYMYALPDDMVMSDDEVSKKLIADKRNLLAQYPLLSSARASAFNYAMADAKPLQTSNMSGYARRMRSLLGMDTDATKPLHNLPNTDMGGFHLIEHLLLRPAAVGDAKLSVCLDANCGHCGEEDPYSFRVSVVLPFWLKRFTNMAFRNYMETLMRAEAPAHLMLKICWVDPAEMKAFEEAYERWALAKQTYQLHLPHPTQAQQKAFSKALGDLIMTLESLRTDFPLATLHDCEDRDEANDNRVFLSGTILGTFKPTHEDGKKIEED